MWIKASVLKVYSEIIPANIEEGIHREWVMSTESIVYSLTLFF